MWNPFKRSDSYSYASRQKATAQWQAGTAGRVAKHRKNLSRNAAKGQAWSDRQH